MYINDDSDSILILLHKHIWNEPKNKTNLTYVSNKNY